MRATHTIAPKSIRAWLKSKTCFFGRTAHDNNEVVDVNLIDVELIDGVPVPIRLRERIRAAGPTNRSDLGKQARPELVRAA